MKSDIKIGIVGADTSHAEAFTELLNSHGHPYHVKGGRVVLVYPGGSPDFELSYSRVPKITSNLQSKFQVEIVDSIEAVAKETGAILLESVDGRVHLEQFRRIVNSGNPVFIDKPLAVSSQDARAIIDLADRHCTPLMSCSALRYAENLRAAVEDHSYGEIIGADFHGPMEIQPQNPGFFWYGIHAAEMLFAVLGRGCEKVSVTSCSAHDLAVGTWRDGRIGTIRGNRCGNNAFGGIIYRRHGSQYVDISNNPKPFYASLVEKIMEFFTLRESRVCLKESLEIIRFLEAANQSRQECVGVEL